MAQNPWPSSQQPPYPPSGGQAPFGYGPPPPRRDSGRGAVIAIVVGVLIVPALGVVSALGIYGVRKYLASAKTSEAKNTVSAIARGAAAAYERETPDGDHQLCASSGPNAPGHGPVPLAVPMGTKYVPSTAAGDDFETGTESGGWRCLKFRVTGPMYYQYHYNAEANLGLSGDEPATRFEARAVGDLDADGRTSSFARTGEVSETGQLQVSSQIHITDEFE